MDSENLIIKNPKDNRQYDSFSLDNGIQVIVVSDPDTAVSAAALVVGVGSYHNPKSQLGNRPGTRRAVVFRMHSSYLT